MKMQTCIAASVAILSADSPGCLLFFYSYIAQFTLAFTFHVPFSEVKLGVFLFLFRFLFLFYPFY